jgi:hypothetical protein
MEAVIGFFVAVAVGLTGIGGGSFTTPALVLLLGLPASEAVGTALVFSAVLRFLAVPFYLVRRHFHFEYLWRLLLGAVPGLLAGTYVLRALHSESWNPVALVVVGVVLALTSALTLFPRFRNHRFARNNARWLPLLAAPIGMGTGLSSAGAGGLGTVLLLNYSELTAAEVVGTDLLFGLGLAALGAAFHSSAGSVSTAALGRLLVGGVPGVLVGCMLAGKVPGRRLRATVAMVALALGFGLVLNGAHALLQRRVPSAEERHVEHAQSVRPSRLRDSKALSSAPAAASPAAGMITAASTASRQIQFGLKLLF